MLFDPPSWLWKVQLTGAVLAFAAYYVLEYRLVDKLKTFLKKYLTNQTE